MQQRYPAQTGILWSFEVCIMGNNVKTIVTCSGPKALFLPHMKKLLLFSLLMFCAKKSESLRNSSAVQRATFNEMTEAQSSNMFSCFLIHPWADLAAQLCFRANINRKKMYQGSEGGILSVLK